MDKDDGGLELSLGLSLGGSASKFGDKNGFRDSVAEMSGKKMIWTGKLGGLNGAFESEEDRAEIVHMDLARKMFEGKLMMGHPSQQANIPSSAYHRGASISGDDTRVLMQQQALQERVASLNSKGEISSHLLAAAWAQMSQPYANKGDSNQLPLQHINNNGAGAASAGGQSQLGGKDDEKYDEVGCSGMESQLHGVLQHQEIMEHHRKRELATQKHQEARKKRKMLIDEQKQQKKAKDDDKSAMHPGFRRPGSSQWADSEQLFEMRNSLQRERDKKEMEKESPDVSKDLGLNYSQRWFGDNVDADPREDSSKGKPDSKALNNPIMYQLATALLQTGREDSVRNATPYSALQKGGDLKERQGDSSGERTTFTSLSRAGSLGKLLLVAGEPSIPTCASSLNARPLRHASSDSVLLKEGLTPDSSQALDIPTVNAAKGTGDSRNETFGTRHSIEGHESTSSGTDIGPNKEDVKASSSVWQQGTTLNLPPVETIAQEVGNIRPGVASDQVFGGSGSLPDLPWVSASGPNGKTISGALYRLKHGVMRVVCTCHGLHMAPEEFISHAAGQEESTNGKTSGAETVT